MRMLKINTRFIRTETKGEVKITYRIYRRTIDIDVDLTRLKRQGCKSIIILNEQGATFFRRYQDGSGLILQNDEIDAWKKVRSTLASFSDITNTHAFELKKPSNAELFRGREVVNGRLAWSGLNYVFDSSINHFMYSIKLR
jgi:hypothetical protein